MFFILAFLLIKCVAHEGKFDENKARYYFQQLISGIEYCHAKGVCLIFINYKEKKNNNPNNNQVCHRDLKPENLLLNEDQILKISDFGLSALHKSEVITILHTN